MGIYRDNNSVLVSIKQPVEFRSGSKSLEIDHSQIYPDVASDQVFGYPHTIKYHTIRFSEIDFVQ